jgi:dephospho-CoA kinase
MIRVGITGGIGSGKSLVCKVLSLFGIPVYLADAEARKLMETDPSIRRELISVCGPEIFTGDHLNRPLMSRLIFGDNDLLKAVNGIVHPAVARHFDAWCARQTGSPYVVQESALLFESGARERFDVVVLVTAPENLRMERVLKRPGMTVEKIRAIVKNQLAEEEKIVGSHVVFHNDGSNLILPGIVALHLTLAHPDNR